MLTHLYLLGDADRVRDGIDQRLLRGHLDDLRAFSFNLTVALAELVSAFQREMDAELIMAGGDDVLLRVLGTRYSRERHSQLCHQFFEATGCRMSFGVSSNLQTAYLNLRRAKSEQTGICFEDSQR